jgi:hypothetical protein
LGTGSGISGEAQGPSREGCNEQTNQAKCRESAHGKEGVDGSSPSEGFGFSPA